MKYLSRITLEPGALGTWTEAQIPRDVYQEHKLVWNFFDQEPDVSRDFLYRRDDVRGGLRYYVLSSRKPREDLPRGWHADEPKEFKPRFRTGQRLYFSARVNPVIRRKGEDGRSHKHDVVMDAKRQARERAGKDQVSAMAELIRQAGLTWFMGRAAGLGFSCEEQGLLVEGYRQHRARGRSKRAIRFSTLDISGTLRVEDPGKFSDLVFNGLGASRGFGCGLVLVKPA